MCTTKACLVAREFSRSLRFEANLDEVSMPDYDATIRAGATDSLGDDTDGSQISTMVPGLAETMQVSHAGDCARGDLAWHTGTLTLSHGVTWLLRTHGSRTRKRLVSTAAPNVDGWLALGRAAWSWRQMSWFVESRYGAATRVRSGVEWFAVGASLLRHDSPARRPDHIP